MGVAELKKIIPVLLIEPGHGSQDQDVLLVANRIGRDGNIIEVVTGDRRGAKLDSGVRFRFAIR